MNSIQKALLTVLLAGGFIASVPAFASSLTISNASFEFDAQTGSPFFSSGGAGSSAVPGWTINGNGNAGVQNSAAYSTIIGAAPDGAQFGYLNNSPASDETLAQVLTDNLLANTSYTLSIDVGGRTDGYNPGTDYSISLYGGATLLSSVTPATPPTGSWSTLSMSYTSAATVSVGSPLEIVISMPASTNFAQLDFDDVRLDSVPVVPEPGAWAFAGLFLLVPVALRVVRSLRKANAA